MNEMKLECFMKQINVVEQIEDIYKYRDAKNKKRVVDTC